MKKTNKNKIWKRNKIKLFFGFAKTSALYFFIAIIILGQTLTPTVAEAATFNFTQSSWVGGVTGTTALHPGNKTGWTEYSNGTGVTAGADVRLSAPTSYTFTDDGTASTSPISPIASGGGFSNGTNSNSTVSGSGTNASVGITPVLTPINKWDTQVAGVPETVSLGGGMLHNAPDDNIYVIPGGSSAGFYKYSISGNSWTTLTAAPGVIGVASRMIRNGADNDIYVTQGNNSTGFYKYSISGNSWTTLTAAPGVIGVASRMIRNGADNDIYVTQGGYTTGFYKYSISGNSWTTLTAAPGVVNYGSNMIRNGADNDIYVTQGGYTTGFYKYSISGNSWTTLTATPYFLGAGSNMIRNGADNDIYVTLGDDGNYEGTGFYKYSISGNSWTTLALVPGPVMDHSTMIRNGSDNDIYVTQGQNYTGFYKYSISGNSWTTLATPGVLSNGAKMIRNGSDNDIYLTLGGGTVFSKYSISGNSWKASNVSNLTSFPGNSSGPMIRNGSDDDIYVTRGTNSIGFSKYSISGNSFTTLANSPGGLTSTASMIRNGSDDYIYVTRAASTTSFYRYSISGNSWTTLTAAPAPIVDGSRTIRNGSDNDIYVTGGVNNVGFYKYSISGNSWTTLTSSPGWSTNGSTLLRNGSDNDIYLTYANANRYLYKYSISGDSWTTLALTPGNLDYGSSMIRNASDNDIYVTQGNNNTGFYKYSISGNSWTTLTAVPAGIRYGGKMIRNGADNDIYVTAGNSTTGFFKYSISGDSWTTLTPAPGIISTGSSMFRNDADNDIYLTQGSTAGGGFYKFTINANSYNSTGTFTSAVMDMGASAGFTTLSYATTLPATTAITLDVRGSMDNATWTGWTTGVASGGSIAGLAGNRYLQYRANLSTGNSLATPLLNSVTVGYTQYAASGNLTSSIYDAGNSANLLSKLSWTATGTSATETVKFQARSSPDGITWSTWCGYADCSGSTYINSAENNISVPGNHPLVNGADDRYMQYKVFLASGGASTPVLTTATMVYVVNEPPAFNPDYPVGGAGGATAAQISVAGADLGKVNISYSARDIDSTSGSNTPNQMTPSFEYSVDGGSNWAAIPAGHLAPADTSIKTILEGPYTTYSATWSAVTTAPGINIANAKIRVTVNDNEAGSNTATALTANFALDTKAPVGTISFDAGVAGSLNSATITIPMPTDQSSVEYLIRDDVTETNPVTTGWTALTGGTTIPWSFDSDIEIKSLKYQFRDSFGNVLAEQTTSTHVPVPSSSFMVQDTSNVSATPAYYDEYIGWQITDAAGFSAYRLEQATSADNITYGAYAPIGGPGFSDVSTNYYVYRNLNSSLFYRFRLAVVGTDGNISVRSNSSITTKPDGIQNFGEGGGGSVLTASKVENVVVTQNPDKTVTVNYRLTDASLSKKQDPSYEAYLFYNIGVTLQNGALVGNTLLLSDASKLKSTGYIQVNNEVIKYTGKTGNTLTGITRGSWPIDASSGRVTRTNSLFFGGTPVWVMASGTTPITIANTTIPAGQNGSIAWNTFSESALSGASYSNVGIKVLVHDKQDALSGPLSSQNDYSENGSLSTLDLTVPTISFSQVSGTADEGTTPVTLTLNLSRTYPFAATVNYTLSGTAGAGDYTLLSGTATIPAGDISTFIQIPVINDTLKELDETVIVTLSGAVNSVLGANPVYTHTIVDNDTISGIQFTVTNSSGQESVGTAQIEITLAEVSGADTTVQYALSGTAGAGDYTLIGGTATVLSGQTTVTIPLPVINDILKEEAETVILTLSNPVNASLGANTVYTYTILDDDAFPSLQFNNALSQSSEEVNTVDLPVSISAPYAENVTFNYAVSGGTAVGGSVDYLLAAGTGTITAGETSTTINIVVFDDDISEETETIIVALSVPVNAVLGVNSSHAYSIIDNEISVTAVSGSNIKATSARISWTTADYTDSMVDYGSIPPGELGAYGQTKISPAKTLEHSVYLGNLTPSTRYYFRTTSTNLAGETTTSASEFTTTAGPVISGVSSGSVTDTTATITWTTDIPASSYVNYSTDSGLSGALRSGAGALVTGHTVALSGLSPGSTYYFSVDSSDANSNVGEDANDGNYHTFSSGADGTPPVITAMATPILTSTQVAITWTTNEPANGKVLYGLSAGSYDNQTQTVETLLTSHLATISTLTGGAEYFYVVESADENGNTTTSEEQTFTTPATDQVIIRQGGGGIVGVAQELYDLLLAENQSYKAKFGTDTSAPAISNIEISGITPFGATISFDTGKETIAGIDYGKETTYGKNEGDFAWLSRHVIKIGGLSLGTEYNFKIKAMDKNNNTATSENQKFTTKFLAEDLSQLQNIENIEQFQKEIEATIESILPSLVPPFIDKPIISDITESSATISFRTNIKSYPIVSYATEDNYDTSKTNPYDGETSDTSEKSVSHTISLINLKPNTKYHMMVKAFSLPQVIGKSEDITFSTAASKIRGSVIDIKKDSFTVVWTTDEPTSSIVEYKNLKTGRISRIVDDVRNNTHSLLIENLTPGTSYQIDISGVNAAGNLAESSTPINVKTSTDNVAPSITNLKVESALVVGRTDRVQTIISWQTDEPSTSTVYYEEGSGSLNKPLANKQEDLELTRNHVVILATFKPGTIYRFTVDSTDDANNIAKPPIRTIITPQKTESIVDIIFKNFDETFNFVNNIR